MHKNWEEINKNQLQEVQALLNRDTAVNGTIMENVPSGHVVIVYALNQN